MKKRGFTLIELLAVIVVLAVIAIISIPLITNVIEKAKEGAAKDGGYNYIKAVETGIAANKLDNSKPDIDDGIYSVFELKNTYKIDVKGNAPTDGSITIENGRITACELTIDNYSFVCNGNELILGTALPEHRMMDSKYINLYNNKSLFHRYIKDNYNVSNADEYDYPYDYADTLSEEDENRFWDTFDEIVAASQKLQTIYFLPDSFIPSSYDSWDIWEEDDDDSNDANPFENNLLIEKVYTVTNNTVPSNAIASKDISVNQDGSVMVWYLDQDNDSKYEMYIGQDGGVIAPVDCNNLFNSFYYFGAEDLEMDLSNMITSYTTDMGGMFRNCNTLISLNISHFDTSKVKNMHSMFDWCEKLTSLDVSHFDTRNVTDMNSMFEGCSSLTSLDVSHFDTRNVTDMECMFYECSGLTSLDVSRFDTKNVKNMDAIFRDCSSLTSLDVSHFNTSRVTSMWDMFHGCSSLTSLDVSHFDTRNVIYMYGMFQDCSSLTSLDVSHFDTRNVTYMSQMFLRCSGLTNLDLSSFDTRNATEMRSMFAYNTNLRTIYVGSNWVINTGTDATNMFNNCGTSTTTLKP